MLHEGSIPLGMRQWPAGRPVRDLLRCSRIGPAVPYRAPRPEVHACHGQLRVHEPLPPYQRRLLPSGSLEDNDHIHLPFVCEDMTPPRRTHDMDKGAEDTNKSIPQYPSCRPTSMERLPDAALPHPRWIFRICAPSYSFPSLRQAVSHPGVSFYSRG